MCVLSLLLPVGSWALLRWVWLSSDSQSWTRGQPCRSLIRKFVPGRIHFLTSVCWGPWLLAGCVPRPITAPSCHRLSPTTVCFFNPARIFLILGSWSEKTRSLLYYEIRIRPTQDNLPFGQLKTKTVWDAGYICKTSSPSPSNRS